MKRERLGMDDPKRCLLLITGAYHLGGGIAAANRLAIQSLQDAGFAVDVFALSETTGSPKHISGHYHYFSNNKFRFSLVVLWTVFTGKYTFVFCDHVNLVALLLPVRIFTKCPILVRLNGIEVFAPNPTFEGRLGLRVATHLTAISDFTRSQLISQFPHLSVATVELSLSVTDDCLAACASLNNRELNLESVDGDTRVLGERYVLLVGRMSSAERYKGQDILIHGMADVIAHHPDAQLVLVGRGDDFDRLYRLACSQPTTVRSNIFMPGFVDDATLQSLYQNCYLFAMPSRGEGFGLVYLEAMRWSRACIGSCADAATNIIVDGETGVLISDPTDPSQVATAISQLMDDPKLVEQMGRNGFQRITQRYLFQQFSQRFVHWIEQSIASIVQKQKS